MNSICIFMPTTIEIDTSSYLYKVNQLTDTSTRVQQYLKGIKQIYDLNKDKNINIIISDNSNYFNNNSIIKEYLETTSIKIIKDVPNNYGKINKGSGVVENWLCNSKILSNYKWIIHFEPRQLLKSNYLIDNFLQNPRNLFTINVNVRHFNTGLFAIKSELLLKYINNYNINTTNLKSIEDDLYQYFINNNLVFDTLDKMDLIWYPNNHIPLHY